MHQTGIENCSEKFNAVEICYNICVSPLIYESARKPQDILDAGLRKFECTDQYRFLAEHTVIPPAVELSDLGYNRNRFGDMEYRLTARFYIPDREYVSYILQYK